MGALAQVPGPFFLQHWHFVPARTRYRLLRLVAPPRQYGPDAAVEDSTDLDEDSTESNEESTDSNEDSSELDDDVSDLDEESIDSDEEGTELDEADTALD